MKREVRPGWAKGASCEGVSVRSILPDTFERATPLAGGAPKPESRNPVPDVPVPSRAVPGRGSTLFTSLQGMPVNDALIQYLQIKYISIRH